MSDLFTSQLPIKPTEFQTLEEAINFCARAQVETGEDWRIFADNGPPPFIVRIAAPIT